MNLDLTKEELFLVGALVRKADPMGIFAGKLFEKISDAVRKEESKGKQEKPADH